jgi:hypothetical protein
MAMNVLIPPMLRAWAKMVGEHPIFPTWTPWWLDPDARLQSIVQAAESLGWQKEPTLDDEWDVQLTTPDTRLVIRCIGAGVDLGTKGKGRDVIADVWRVLALTSPPPRDTLGVHLVSVEPHLAQAGDDRECRSVMNAWRTAHPWPNDGMSVWVDTISPMPRNEVGTVFPGLGLIARVATKKIS